MPHPPKLFLRFFRWYCHPSLKKHIEGDLMELYGERIKEFGKRKADRKFVIDVILLFRRGIIRPYDGFGNLNSSGMYKNYLRVAIRNLRRNKGTSFINIFGLTIGLTSCLLIVLYIQHEMGFDTFQHNGKRIARVIMEYGFDGAPATKRGNFTSTKVAPVLARTFPEVESSIRMDLSSMIVKLHDNPVTEPNFMFADSTFFKIFAFKFIEGNPESALDGPFKVVLTESSAKRYFGNESPLGKLLFVGDDEKPYEVTGLMKDYPSNSQIKFDFLSSFSSMGVNQEETYWDANYTTYLLLKDENSMDRLQAKVTPFMKKEMAGTGSSINFILERFDKIHLHSEYAAFVPNTSVSYLYMLSAVALLILLIVCSTYINLGTARSLEKAKEVGIRKTVGATKTQLFWQFMGESFVIFFFSVLLSIMASMATLHYFNDLTEKDMELKSLLSPSFILFALALALIVGLLAGCYPAILLSGMKPARVLKGIFRNSASGKWMQRSLIVFQFAISAFLLFSTFIIQKQLYFIQHKNLGYDRSHTLVLPLILPPEQKLEKLSVMKQELKSISNVISISGCNSTPVKIASGYSMRSATMSGDEQISVTGAPIDEDYIKTTGLQLIAGEDFIEQDLIDVLPKEVKDKRYHFILNESSALQLGWTPEQAVGKKMFMGDRAGTVKGVIKDFHFESMHNPIRPLVLFTELRSHGLLLVKISGQNIPETIVTIEKKWKLVAPYMPFEYTFLDDDYSKLYRSELQLHIVTNLFASIAIILACLGLFGLSGFVVKQRVKEISIRKILGASLTNIVGILSGNFTKLIVIAIMIAIPLAYYVMKQWLQAFSYRVEMDWWIFIAVGILAVGIAWLTVSIQSLKAALSNPVENLRTE